MKLPRSKSIMSIDKEIKLWSRRESTCYKIFLISIVLWLVSVVSMIAFSMCLHATGRQINSPINDLIWIVVVLVTIMGGSILSALGSKYKLSILKMQLKHEMARYSQEEFILFLRSFGRLDLAHAPVHRMPNPVGYGPDSLTGGDEPFVYYLGKALASRGRVVAMGNQDEVFGQYGGTIAQDEQVYLICENENWFEVFHKIADTSKFIVLIPETTLGIRREMKTLSQSKLIAKTLVFMPPSMVAPKREIMSFKYAFRWNQVRDFLNKINFSLPTYREEGMLYLPNPDFSVKTSVPLINASHAGRLHLESLDDITEAIQSSLHNIIPSILKTKTEHLSQLIKTLEEEQKAYVWQGQRYLDS